MNCSFINVKSTSARNSRRRAAFLPKPGQFFFLDYGVHLTYISPKRLWRRGVRAAVSGKIVDSPD